MNQVLHIFRKDTRSLWVEIAIWVVALALYALLYPNRWDYSPTVMRSQTLYVAAPMLFAPAALWLLITRVIQAESLVGDRQWWITRPYEKGKLLAAKALFIAAWIYVPFAIAEAAILKEAGLSPLAHVGGWCSLLLIASAYGVLPLMAVAAVTANFARMTLTLFGAIVVGMGASALASLSPSGYESNVPYDHNIWIAIMVIAGAAFAVVTQFATRRAWLSRAVLVGAAVLASGVGMLIGSMRQSEIDRDYPTAASSGAAPVQLALGAKWDLTAAAAERPGKVYVDLPVVFSGVADGSAVEVNDVKVTIDDEAGGRHWTAPWWASRVERFLPGEHQAKVPIMLDRTEYERFKTGPVTLHLALAVTELHANGSTTATISSGDFPVSGFGVCSGQWLYRFSSQLMCRSSGLDPAAPTLVSTVWSKVPDSDAYVPPGGIRARSWVNYPFASAQVFRLLPVWNDTINLYPISIHGPLSSTRGLELAVGTPVQFTQYAVAGRTQVSLTIPNFQLPPEWR